MWIGLLGPLLVRHDDRPVALGGPRLRALLARLAVEAAAPVPVEALAEAVWPGDGPEHPAPALQSLVARLRRDLPDRTLLRRVPAGYRLDVDPQDVDLGRFETLARQGRRALVEGEPARAVELLRSALTLWRGDPLVDVPPSPYTDAVAARLTNVRLGVLEDRIEAELTCGSRNTDLVGELQELITGNPLRERLRVLLLRTLDAQGRQPEALRAYEDYRTLLADELGTDPGRELTDLHLRLLRREPEREPPVTAGLRSPLTTFVGREEERRRIAERLGTGRLVTLTGTGGVGKTRLATAAASDWSRRSGRPVWVAELAALTGPSDVPLAVAAAAGVRGSGSATDAVSRLAEAVSGAEVLLVLDNCEHVIDAAAHLAHDLLGRCPRLRVLATSREPLGVTGEALVPVRPLPPDTAVRLFTDRARAARPGFEPSAEAVAEVCGRLDGLPLAIELAAARLRTMPLDRLATRLHDRFRLLAGGSRVAPERHRTLRAVVAWSWDLLDGDERDAIERLAAFPAGFDPAAAEHLGIDLDTLDALVDKALLQPSGDRYQMLDTIREYGLEQLHSTGRIAAARADHLAYALELSGRAGPGLRGREQPAWVRSLAVERDNLTAAFRDAADEGALEPALRIGVVLGLFWLVHGDHAEAIERLGPVLHDGQRDAHIEADLEDLWAATAGAYLLNAVFAGKLADAAAGLPRSRRTDRPVHAFVAALLCLAERDIATGLAVTAPHVMTPHSVASPHVTAPEPAAPPPTTSEPWTRAMLHLVRAFLLGGGGDTKAGGTELREAAAGFREAGERWGRALALMSLASVHTAAGELDQATAALDESTALVRELGADDNLLVWLAGIRISTGDTRGARAELGEVVDHGRSAQQVALARLSLADLARQDHDLGEAAEQLRLAAEQGRPEDLPFQSVLHTTAGFLAVARGDLDDAEARLRQALTLAETMPDPPMAARIGVGLALLRERQGDSRTAATMLGAAHVLRGGPDVHDPDVAALTRDLEAVLGPREFQAAYAEGQDKDNAQALRLLRRRGG